MLTDIQTYLTDLLGPFGPLMVVGLLGVLLILVTLPALLGGPRDPLEKLKAQNAAAASGNTKERLRNS